ncbi:Mitochondrial DNA replication protein yhm2 [Exserohilum turcicum]
MLHVPWRSTSFVSQQASKKERTGPGFPDQNLGTDPDLILHPPETGHRGLGIAPWESHSINRILVEYLGNEEILLVACDDGDVIGYRTEVIHRAIERASQDGAASEDDVHVFLHRNVGASAWGLAVHREARIIAISANTYRITVIAYALAQDTDELDTLKDNCESSRCIPQFPFWRQTETVFTLSATNNLPALSFYHNSGRWLLSSCIDGKTTLWDLHTRRAAVTCQLGWCISAKDLSSPPSYGSRGFTCACPAASNVLHGAWGTMVLDTRSAYYLPPEAEQSLGSRDVSDVFRDVSAQKKRFTVENRSTRIPYMELSESEDELSDFEDEEDSVDGQMQEAQPSDSTQGDDGFSQVVSAAPATFHPQ